MKEREVVEAEDGASDAGVAARAAADVDIEDRGDTHAATDDSVASEDGASDGAPDDDAETDAEPAVERSWSWHLTRVTGLFLAVLIPLHFAVVVVGHDVGQTTAASASQRMRNPTWRATEWLVLVLALGHAFLALRLLIADSARADGTKEALVVVTGVAAVLLAVALTAVMVTYR